MAKKIALSAGHMNQSGGQPIERAIVAHVTAALARACRAAGFDVRVVQDQDGLVPFPGTLDKAAARVVAWAQGGWIADVFLEVHADSLATRGAFAVYPDWPAASDTDAVVRDTLGPALANAIAAATGIPRRGSGVMSERQSGIGSQGARLGIFRVTAPLRQGTRRLILEIGSYGARADLAIMQAAGFPERIAAGLASALAAWAGIAPAGTEDRQVIGMDTPSCTIGEWAAALYAHKAPLEKKDLPYLWASHLEWQVDPGFFVAMWKHEAGSPLGGSPLQQQSHMPINIRAAVDEWRPVVPFNGGRWLQAQTFKLGYAMSILHLKNTHGAAGRLTVRQIIPVHAPASDGNNPEAFIKSVLEDMAYIARREP
jgi:N-acetylmuramoyl-L-alanine amidase